ncbi:MAG: hypothetical protein ACREA9_27790 [Pyrinomonadaceae bacterium]
MILDPFIGNALPAFDFARTAFAIADDLSRAQVYLRRDPGLKEFLEEVLPMARFATSWEAPERHVTVEYFGPNHPHDATITLSGAAIDDGFFEPLYDLEVTSAAFRREHLEREALARYGSVFSDPNIHRVGSRRRGDDHIISVASAEDGDTPRKDLESWILTAISAKAGHTYSRASILLVRAEPSRPLALSEWWREGRPHNSVLD